ncbi:DUF928 domain-containing protein [Phormidium sp. LEGE 05292]|uniref:DUF928 domain-containing protein n=1 Tax=[Phormidium] sp. LEGE 05292 TaxID=767427 RepID=UPI0018830101|nr:DUF928 domain-containing protein [Phormidium sp. LEGE 05292]MBE9229782.1 DUF928 domain-containing protein [Phormidium sp. LEGE 05292]
MNKKLLALFAIALSLETIIAASPLSSVKAQSISNNQSQTIQSTLTPDVTFDPPGSDKPDDTAGGASRGGGCPQEVISVGGCVVPLMPGNKDGLTVTSRPTFFIYVPKDSAKEVFFSLVDANNKNVYQTKIQLTGKSGILQFTLPENAPLLEIGKNYQWAFIMIGKEGLRPDSPGVKGSIRRIETDSALQIQLQNITPIQRAALYGKNGIWYETLASLAEARKLQPTDANLVNKWEQLLKSVGLEAIASQPLLN